AGIIALERSQPEAIFDRMHSENQRVDCFPASFDAARVRMANILKELDAEPASQLKLISKRDGYMMNSWYANVAKLKSPRRRENYLYMHPTDAEARQLSDGDQVRIHNQYGTIAAPLKLSDDLRPGVVAMTHGWGQAQSKGMQTAAEFPGSNCNVLLPSGPGSFEPLSNQSHMTGIAVEVGRHT
ncbi:MAG: molybdopterin dinucleotide binding domain-containing protein, partial [Pseudomonadota bacterium]